MSIKKTSTHKKKEPMVITDTPGTAFEKVPIVIEGPLPAI